MDYMQYLKFIALQGRGIFSSLPMLQYAPRLNAFIQRNNHLFEKFTLNENEPTIYKMSPSFLKKYFPDIQKNINLSQAQYYYAAQDVAVLNAFLWEKQILTNISRHGHIIFKHNNQTWGFVSSFHGPPADPEITRLIAHPKRREYWSRPDILESFCTEKKIDKQSFAKLIYEAYIPTAFRRSSVYRRKLILEDLHRQGI